MILDIFKEQFFNAEVLCLESYCKYILAGIGNYLFIYDYQELKLKIKIFTEERVHEIYKSSNKSFIILKGCKEIAFVTLSENARSINCQITLKLKCKDWIQDLFFDEKKHFLILAMSHNFIEIWDITSKVCMQTINCEERCILYCCKLVGNNLENLVLLCGTVFSEIVIWAPCISFVKDQSVLHRLRGHNGVIFSIEVNTCQKIICSTSDDRSVCIWSINTLGSILDSKNWENANITLLHTLFGHTARVWKNIILANHFISVGEDSKLCVWNKNGKLENYLHLHQDSGIRGLSTHKDSKMIITGGEDGGIVLLNAEKLHSPAVYSSPVCYKLKEGIKLPRKVAFVENDIVCLTDKGCFLQAESEIFKKNISENIEFSDYNILVVSSCRKYFALGSVKGQVIVVDAKSNSILFEEKLINGKLFSMHWVNEVIIVCTLYGALTVYEIQLLPIFKLLKKKNFLLPYAKERWTTCALMHRNCLFLGDRMGSLHVYSMNSSQENPHQSFIKIHGHLGVTHIARENDTIFTAGRDGTVKQYHFRHENLTQSATYKLPMEWIWKIVFYNNEKLIFGFSTIFLIVWSLKQREIRVKFACGGGHRSCDFIIIDDLLKFIYIKDKKVQIVNLYLNSCMNIRSGFHGKEIYCLRILQTNPILFVSGGEDTTLRISCIKGNELDQLYILGNHISSVKDLYVHSVSDDERIIFSVGGRAQISALRFNLKSHNYKELENLFLKVPNKRITQPSSEGETRVMCIDSVATKNGLILAAGCSDRQIRMFIYEKKLSHLTSLVYTHCILKIKCFKLDSLLIVISMGTDGRIVFWDITNIALNPESAKELHSVKIHQSGINSFEMKVLENGKFILATGGDDNLLSVVLWNFNFEEKKFHVSHLWKKATAHSCQITGIKLLKDVLLTVSIDQRLTVWRLNVKEADICMKFISQYLTAVSDVQGMDACTTDDSILIFLYGKGVEALEIDFSALKE